MVDVLPEPAAAITCFLFALDSMIASCSSFHMEKKGRFDPKLAPKKMVFGEKNELDRVNPGRCI